MADSRARPAKTGFRRPVKGHISQGYGCQSRRAGHCLRFHDGIDIATRRGARVRASATGYVAYVGWNPWDEQRRAFIVIIGHAGGYETIYAHLLPIRTVRAGQRVARGQPIGRAGSTGHSTGPHVHWEVSRGFRTLDPQTWIGPLSPCARRAASATGSVGLRAMIANSGASAS